MAAHLVNPGSGLEQSQVLTLAIQRAMWLTSEELRQTDMDVITYAPGRRCIAHWQALWY